jgi:carotenoid cleavage dioxygenase
MTAHPKIDPQTQAMFFFGYGFTPPYVRYSVVSATGDLIKTEAIELPVGVMMHDFAITENYAIFMDLPLNFRPERLALGQSALAFEPDQPSRFGIMPKLGTNQDIQWFEAPSCFVFHVLNAYEAGEEIVLIACRMQAFDLQGNGNPQDSIPYLHQWCFNLTTGAVTETQLSSLPCEFPQINPAYVGRKNRYGYAGKMSASPMPLFDGVIKYDLGTEATPTPSQIYEFGPNRYGGETVFAPHPEAKAEDDGWLLTFVHDQETQQSELLILSAQDLAQPVVRILLPQRVPFGFHGLWVSQANVFQTTTSSKPSN